MWRNALSLPDLERALQPPFASRPWRNTPEFRVMPLAVGEGVAAEMASGASALGPRWQVWPSGSETEGEAGRLGTRGFRTAEKQRVEMPGTAAALQDALGHYAPGAPGLATHLRVGREFLWLSFS